MKIKDVITIGMVSGNDKVACLRPFLDYEDADVNALSDANFIVSYKEGKTFETRFVSSHFNENVKLATTKNDKERNELTRRLMYAYCKSGFVYSSRMGEDMKELAQKHLEQIRCGREASIYAD